MATESVKCLLCKEIGTNDTPFLYKNIEDAVKEGCTCCNEKTRIHIRCAKMYAKLHDSILKKYIHDYKMCRECNKCINPNAISYPVGDDETITLSNCHVETWQGWLPSEPYRSEAMRQVNGSFNIGLKYQSKKNNNLFFLYLYILYKYEN